MTYDEFLEEMRHDLQNRFQKALAKLRLPHDLSKGIVMGQRDMTEISHTLFPPKGCIQLLWDSTKNVFGFHPQTA